VPKKISHGVDVDSRDNGDSRFLANVESLGQKLDQSKLDENVGVSPVLMDLKHNGNGAMANIIGSALAVIPPCGSE